MELNHACDNEMLAAGLGAAAIVERGKLPLASTAECEIVACRMPDGSQRRLFCKYGPLVELSPSPHHLGVAYEVQVYDQLLSAWREDVPELHGFFLDESTQTIGLALNYIDGATTLDQVSQPKAGLEAAARWIARFHRWSDTAAVPSFLCRYDTEFYRVWMQRAGQAVSGTVQERYPWLPDLCQRCQRRLPALLPPTTIIHGDYQADNILVLQGRNIATDWESAVLAAGEIDLANLTQGWSDDLVAQCERQYCLARWPDGTPDDFALRLTAARVFLHLRRLGELNGEDGTENSSVDFDELLRLAERLSTLER